MGQKHWRPWQRQIQKIIFALLLVNTCLLAATQGPPFFGYPALFAEKSAPLLAMEIPAQQDSTLLFGNLRLETAEGLSLPLARLLINGQPAGSFDTGQLTVRVYEGDLLSLDGSAYQLPLLFYLRAVSSNIDSSLLPISITTTGSISLLPPIRFK